MLKRIDVSELELGMFIHRLEGNWFRHPVWKSRFVLKSERTLAALQASRVPAVIIDTERGAPERSSPRAPTAGPEALRGVRALQRGTRRAAVSPVGSAAAEPAELRSTAPTSMAREFGLANRIAQRSRRTITRVFLEARLGKTIQAGMVEPVVDEIFASIQRNPHAFNGLMRCKRDSEFIYRHALACCALMISLARQLRLPPAEIRQAGMAGLLLDTGIGHLPVDLGDLGGDLGQIAPEVFQTHVRLGHDLLVASGLPEPVTRACLEHHERVDGAGYPAGTATLGLSLLGRMAAICDRYDWLIDGGGTGVGLDPAAALSEITTAGSGLDAELAREFMESVGVYPVGSLVELSSGRVGMVVDQDGVDGLRPRVRVFWSDAAGGAVPVSDIALASCFGEDRIVGSARLAGWCSGGVAPLRERLFAGACAG